MNESEPINNLENEITFLQSMADLVERAADMRQAKVPMTVYISSLGVYVCNSKAVHNNSQKAVEAQNSTSTQHSQLAIALMDKMLDKYDFAIDNDMLGSTINDSLKEWRSATGKRG